LYYKANYEAHVKKFNHIVFVYFIGSPLRSADTFVIIAPHNPQRQKSQISKEGLEAALALKPGRAKALGGHCECLRNKPRRLSSLTLAGLRL
jgi:hypothetical protein